MHRDDPKRLDPLVCLALERTLDAPIARLTPLAGGFSHQTTLVTDAQGRAVVLRTGQAAEVEASVMRLARTVVPVPKVLTRGHDIEGGDFVVLEYVQGATLEEQLMSSLSAADAEALGRAVAALLAETSAVRFKTPGFFRDRSLVVHCEPPWSELLVPVTERCMAQCGHRLSAAEQAQWLALCTQAAPLLRQTDEQALLVHSDFNPKNILVARADSGWQITALLDWEFAYSGSPLADAGNLLRFAHDYPDEFVDAFTGEMDSQTPIDNWREVADALDLFALSQLLTKPVGHPIADKVEHRVRSLLTRRQSST